ncbi:MAG TPA: hypothetical protein VK808_12590 [Bacteroidia bacterium]|jgi:hypothetical protein|nr:hypothetical protein [Bacteroidia bacterium]
MQVLSIYTRRIYDINGEKKAQWYKAGILKETDGGRKFIRLFHQPHVDFFVVDNNENSEVSERESQAEES